MASTVQLTREDLIKTAHLARLNLSEEEIAKYMSQLQNVFSYLEVLSSVETGDTQTTTIESGMENFREDIIVKSMPKNLALSTANTDGNFVIAPKTIHKE